MDTNHRIRDVFDAAIQLPREQRSAFLRDQCGHDRPVYDELVRLIEAYERSVETQGEAMGGEANDSIPRFIGYGAYEIVRELGRGGMGAVYLARRVDGTFDRDVAVKVVRGDRLAPTALERFSRERRLLARLRHPGIATLFDAGSTEEGTPYFVMEYVDGVPLTTYCDRKRLDVRGRVDVFMRVCEAVACAHRAPVVHCDLKPANILVDAEGAPRILDFGIATALTRGGQEEEPALDPYGSPRYASPEQIRGEPVQTTSDVYSLGVVLHELLVGRSPVRAAATVEEPPSAVVPSALFEVGDETGHRLDAPTQVAALRSTSVVELHAAIRGDLDAIVGKCLQAAPELRYPTVDALLEDLRGWLEHRPVAARNGSVAYVASRFARRHQWLVAGITGAVLLIAGALVGMVYQWRAADEARRLAERRFDDVRTLATSMFDVDAALAPLAGATAARQLIVENASRYLDRLSQNAGADHALSLELAESYRRLGDMLGNPNTPNLGQREQALQKYQVAATHVAAAAVLRPEDPAVAFADARVAASRADVLQAQRAIGEARKEYERSTAILQRLLQQDSDNIRFRQALAGVYRPLGDLSLAESDGAAALQTFQKARALDLAVLARDPEAEEPRRLLALTQLRVAEALVATGQRNDAIAAYDEAAKLLGTLAARQPANARLTRDVAVGRMKLARLMEADGNNRARAELERALETFRELARADALNAGAQRDLLVALVALGDVIAASDGGRAREHYSEAQRLAETLQAEPFGDPQAARDLRLVRERLSQPATSAAPESELQLAVMRNGAEVPFDKHARPPTVGEVVRVSWKPIAGRAQYLLSLGGEGRASLLSRDEVAAGGWHLPANGPLPSQTLLLLTSPRPLMPSVREGLIDRLSKVPTPRDIPPDAHILWRSRQLEVLDTTATARGGGGTEWTALVRKELERIPELRFSGRTFPLAPR